MNILECNTQLRNLITAHESYQISLTDYRQQRKQLLEQLDKTLNGTEPTLQNETPAFNQQQAGAVDSNSHDNDKTQPYFSAKLGKCIGFLKGKNEQ